MWVDESKTLNSIIPELNEAVLAKDTEKVYHIMTVKLNNNPAEWVDETGTEPSLDEELLYEAANAKLEQYKQFLPEKINDSYSR